MAIDPSKFPPRNQTQGRAEDIEGRRIRAMAEAIVDVDRRLPRGGSLTADGGVAVYTIAHGLGVVPVSASVVAGSAGARAAFHVAFDATNITVTYAAATAAGAGAVVLHWMAFRA